MQQNTDIFNRKEKANEKCEKAFVRINKLLEMSNTLN